MHIGNEGRRGWSGIRIEYKQRVGPPVSAGFACLCEVKAEALQVMFVCLALVLLLWCNNAQNGLRVYNLVIMDVDF